MQAWLGENYAFFLPFFFVAMWILVGYAIAVAGGWRRLAKRFRALARFDGEKWGGQSARMGWVNYNGALTIGADKAGLFMVPFFVFRSGHPPLFIPWMEVTAARRTRRVFFLSFDFVELQLGRAEGIPFTINAMLAAKLEMAAGSGWPASCFQAAQSPPPSIG